MEQMLAGAMAMLVYLLIGIGAVELMKKAGANIGDKFIYAVTLVLWAPLLLFSCIVFVFISLANE